MNKKKGKNSKKNYFKIVTLALVIGTNVKIFRTKLVQLKGLEMK